MISHDSRGRQATTVRLKPPIHDQAGYKRIFSQQTKLIQSILFMTPAALVPRRWSSMLLASAFWALATVMTLWAFTRFIAMLFLNTVPVVAAVLEVRANCWHGRASTLSRWTQRRMFRVGVHYQVLTPCRSLAKVVSVPTFRRVGGPQLRDYAPFLLCLDALRRCE